MHRPYDLRLVGCAGAVIRGGFAPLVLAVGFEVWRCLLVWFLVGERQDLGIVVSVRPGWVRNYFTYFSVYSARCSDAPARGLGQSRGHQWGGRR